MIILIGPSGVGKSSFLDCLLKDYPQSRDIITYTTRSMRQGESEGNPYHFVTSAQFERLKSQGFFVEYATVHNNNYGTPLDQIEQAWKQNQIVVMDIDIQGAKTLKSKFPQALSIFILPPNLDALRNRVLKREGNEPKDMNLRMRNAEIEMAQASKFDHQIINDHFEVAYSSLKKIIDQFLRNG
ncbi:MAG: guanylate kinase [Bdellovibrionales bacterium]|nr:guanylate kinase [Bdellovibrionales bacterium]